MNVLFQPGQLWIQRLFREHWEQGRNTPWMGPQSVKRLPSTHSVTPKCNVAKPPAALYLKSRKKTREPVKTLIRTRRKHASVTFSVMCGTWIRVSFICFSHVLLFCWQFVSTYIYLYVLCVTEMSWSVVLWYFSHIAHYHSGHEDGLR